jgi:hypothetical protein
LVYTSAAARRSPLDWTTHLKLKFEMLERLYLAPTSDRQEVKFNIRLAEYGGGVR